MKKEIESYIRQLQDAYNGEIWYGRSLQAILNEINPGRSTIQSGTNQHSLLQLLYHIITWREFTINRLQPQPVDNLQYFEQNDWQELDHTDETLWKSGLEKLNDTQQTFRLINGKG